MAAETPKREKRVEYIPIAQIHATPSNPPSRMQPGGLKSLVKSIRADSLQYPILVSRQDEDSFQIIDGHRRYAVLKGDGHEMIPCIVADGNSAHLYAVVNGTAKALSAKDWALVYVTGGQVPNGVTKNNLEKLAQLIGNDEIRAMAESGTSPGVYPVARRVSKYAYDTVTDTELLAKIVRWLIRNRETSNCLGVIINSQPAHFIRDAVEQDRKVQLT